MTIDQNVVSAAAPAQVTISSSSRIRTTCHQSIFKSTKVLYPKGVCHHRSHVIGKLESELTPSAVFLLTPETSFHPVTYFWPDQPTDKEYIVCDKKEIKVQYCVTTAWDKTNNVYYLGKDIPPQRKADQQMEFFCSPCCHE